MSDRQFVSLVLVLGLVALGLVVTAAILLAHQFAVPNELWTILGTVLGSLAGVLSPRPHPQDKPSA